MNYDGKGLMMNLATIFGSRLSQTLIGALIARIQREESHLALDSYYGSYMARVKFRVLPFVF